MEHLPFKLQNADLWRTDSYVGGQWVTAKSSQRFEVIDPGTGKAFTTCPNNNVEDVDAVVDAASLAFSEYRKVAPQTRARMLNKWYQLILDNREDLATLLTYETGKSLAESRTEVDYANSFLSWFAGEAERIHGITATLPMPGRRLVTIKQPIGVSVAFVPWNFPMAMVLRKVGAALAAGCTMIVKPSPETPLSALALAHLATKAGFTDGVLNIITTDISNTPTLCEKLCKHPLVKKVTFTGSTRVGQIIAGHCTHGIKKLTLELGGNCPFIVFDDANMELAVESLSALKWRNAGQSCTSANRVYVQRGIYDEFVDKFVVQTKTLKVGHGAHPESTLGAVTVPQSLDKIGGQIADAIRLGAKLIHGGSRLPDLDGFFFEPTVLIDMNDKMLIAREESFGPICAIFPFETEDEVVKAANNTEMGLASYVFTRDVHRMWRMLESLEAGMIGMNTGNQAAAQSPFGGIKESGYGKESGPEVAVNEYLITKSGTFTIENHY